MSKLRPECRDATGETLLPDETVLFLVKQAIRTRTGLIHGKLRSKEGACAMGCFWDAHPRTPVSTALIDEIAAVNDSMPLATPKLRWKMVNSWLRMKLAVIARRSEGAK